MVQSKAAAVVDNLKEADGTHHPAHSVLL